jgi:hypothetical protein
MKYGGAEVQVQASVLVPHSSHLDPGGNKLWYPMETGWVGPIAGLDAVEKLLSFPAIEQWKKTVFNYPNFGQYPSSCLLFGQNKGQDDR